MEQQIKNIIGKVRELINKHDKRLNFVVEPHPSIELKETNNGELELKSILFVAYYASLEVTNKQIIYKPECKNPQVLFKYKGFDALLKLE